MMAPWQGPNPHDNQSCGTWEPPWIPKKGIMQTIYFTTQSGTVYEVGYSQTQEVYVRWEDTSVPLEHANIKGLRVKVWENCTIHGLELDIETGMWKASPKTLAKGLIIQATDRYTRRPVSRATTPIVRAARADGKVLI
jgi:hypothetical protein